MSQTPPPPPPPGGGTPGDDEPGPPPDHGQQSGAGDGDSQPDYGQPQPDYGHPGGEQISAYGQEYAQPGYGDGPGAPAAGTNTKAVAALVLGILGIVLSCACAIGIVAGIPAIIVGAMGRKEASQTGESGNGMALAGIITGAIATVLSIVFVILIIAGVMSGITNFDSYSEFGNNSDNFLIPR